MNWFFGSTDFCSRTCCWLFAAVSIIFNWKRVRKNISALFTAFSLAKHVIVKEKIPYACKEDKKLKSMEYQFL